METARETARAVVQEALDTSFQYREGSARRWGLREPVRNVIGSASQSEPALPTTPLPIAKVLPIAEAIPLGKPWLPWILSAGLALGGGGIGATVAGLLLSAAAEQPTEVGPAAEPDTAGVDLLLADLQERGFHLPLRLPEVVPDEPTP